MPSCVLIPSYDDWESLARLLPALDRALAAAGREADVLIVDDGSPTPPLVLERALGAAPPRALRRVDVVRLVRNLGHQRAIAVGLALRAAGAPGAAVVVMDGDGEDRPEHVPILLDALDERPADAEPVVFAQRRKRMEGAAFVVLYRAYRLLQRVLTGVGMDVGNFSAVPARHLPALAVTSDLWNHYPAAVLAARLPVRRVPLDRGARLEGRSRLGLTGLALHGLGAMSVFAERIGARLLAACAVAAAVLLALLGAVVAVRLFTPWAIPGWATSTSGILAMLLVQVVGLAACFTFTVLNGRNAVRFIPSRDHALFVHRHLTLYERASAPAPPARPTGGARDGWVVRVRRRRARAV